MKKTAQLMILCLLCCKINAQTELWGMTSQGGQYNTGTIFKTNLAGTTHTVEYSFYHVDLGVQDYTSLFQASNGKTYGTGTSLFEYDVATNTYTNIMAYTAATGYGSISSLVEASNNKLYGVTNYGGSNSTGVIYQFDPATNIYTKKYDFAALPASSTGCKPLGALLPASNGLLYGMAAEGGSSGFGVLFQYDPVSNIYTKLFDFTGTNGKSPSGGLIQASNGLLYGLTPLGGSAGQGVLFQFDPATNTYTKTIDFNQTLNNKGSEPVGALMQATDGKLYGFTSGGGTFGKGTLFQYDPLAATLTKKVDFSGGANGDTPSGQLLQASDGNLYGTTTIGGVGGNYGIVFQYNPVTGVLAKKVDFNGFLNGRTPSGYLMQNTNGKIYGVTLKGGASHSGGTTINDGVGTLFQYDVTTGTYTKKLDFDGAIDGNMPQASLFKAPDGNLYGMTSNAGAYDKGTLFKYEPITHLFTKILDFDGISTGASPAGSLMLASNGKLYGLTVGGGINGQGTLFQYDVSTATFTKKIDFDMNTGAANPYGDLMQASDGNLYGMSVYGGATSWGTLFQYNPVTNAFVTKINFDSNDNSLGGMPRGSLIQASNGKIYGMNTGGGTPYSKGILFEYDPITNNYIKRKDFLDNATDGYYTIGSLIQASDGKLYRMTHDGPGTGGSGTLFRYDPVTYIFTKMLNLPTGTFSEGSLFQASNGKLFGMGWISGTNSQGTYFEYDIPTGSFTIKHNFNGTDGALPRSTNFIELPAVPTLSIGVINPVVCGGNNLSVTFTTTGTFTTGNVFTAQLSDAAGSFVAPANIGAVTSVTSGAIAAMIPVATIFGTNYRVRVISSNPSMVTSNSSNSITVNPAPVMSVNSGSICSGNSFTISPVGAVTYTYSGGSTNVSPLVNTIYTITGAGSNGCTATAQSSVTVITIPVLAITGSTAVCIGSSTQLLASGAATYAWSNGATTASITVNQSVNSSYTVSTSNACGATSQTITVVVDPNCQDVWPGDANSDGLVDNTDVLELGLHFTQTGPARATTSNTWQSYFATNWPGTISTGQNVNHSDCNGDGVVDTNDTLAIYNNYGLMHAFKQIEQPATNPQLSIVPDQTMVAKGTWGTASVYLGDVSAPINNINGLAFTVNFDQSLIEPNSFYVEYPISFINPTNQNLKFNKPDFTNGKIYTAATHTNNVNVSGNGKIAILRYKIKSTLTTDAVLNISLAQAKQSNASGILTLLTTGSATLAAIGASVGIDELVSGNTFAVFPNPANTFVTIQSTNVLQKIEVLSVTGQIILSEVSIGKQYQLDLSSVANGVYFLTVTNEDHVIQRKKIMVQR